jgi:hypothetical protein
MKRTVYEATHSDEVIKDAVGQIVEILDTLDETQKAYAMARLNISMNHHFEKNEMMAEMKHAMIDKIMDGMEHGFGSMIGGE